MCPRRPLTFTLYFFYPFLFIRPPRVRGGPDFFCKNPLLPVTQQATLASAVTKTYDVLLWLVNHVGKFLRSAFRIWSSADDTDFNLGFRLARTL